MEGEGKGERKRMGNRNGGKEAREGRKSEHEGVDRRKQERTRSEQGRRGSDLFGLVFYVCAMCI